MTLEIIVFIVAILFGIVIYVRESKTNKVYRFFNKLMYSKKLQMKPEAKKGFVYEQSFLLRLVWITALFLVIAVVVAFVTPFNMFYFQYFVSAIVGTILGTYIASMFFGAKKGLTKENIKESIEKGKEFIEDLAEGKKDETDPENSVEIEAEKDIEKTEIPPKKSARDRLKDKGMIN